MQAGASGLSILTDKKFFGGINEDLRIARRYNFCPILRKDFVIDSYQLHEARAIGADVILLIAAILTTEEMESYAKLAHELGMQVLVEVHSAEELKTVPVECMDMVGVNNRNLKTFEVSLDTSLELASLLPDSVVKVSESGISSAEAVLQLKRAGFEGFLIGETFMATPDPALACARFIRSIETLAAEGVS
jgi:indole-3-glycerol phosphate synthase